MNNIKDLVKELKAIDAKIFVDGENLRVDFPKGANNEKLKSVIKDRKLDLIKYIESVQKNDYFSIPTIAQNKDNSYPLSSSQRRLWVLSQFEEANIAYNMPEIYVFEGSLDISALEYSFNVLLERHEILRTVFKEDAQGEVRQYVQSVEEKIFKINYQDLRQAIRQTENVQAIVQREFIIPFNLAIGPLLRAALYQIADDKWIFTYTMHHIISDGWSMNIMIKELLTLYQSYSKGETNPLTPLRIQYKDYAVWQQERLQDVALQEHKNYWIEQFTGELPILELPADKLRPAVKTYNGRTIEKTINKNLTTNIKTLSHQEGCTLFMSLLALVNTLLYRYTGQEDIVIGSPIAGRDHADLEDQIGFYVNTLALRTQFKGTDNFKDLLKNIKQTTLEAYEHQMYPFDELLNNLNLQRDMSRSALFDVMLVLQNNETQTLEDLGGIKVQKYEGEENVISKFDLTFNFIETRDTLQLSIGYNTDIYTKNSIERLSNHFEQLLRTIVEQPSISINQLDYLTKEEKHQLLVAFNDTTATYSKDKTIIELFEEQVEKTPSNIAITFENITLTYKELDEKSNQLANYIRKNYTIQADDLIGIMLDRSEQMIIAILGILKSGGAYIPIDPEYPKARKEYIIKDTAIKILLTQTEYIFDLDYYDGAVFAIDVQLDDIDASTELPKIVIHLSNLAYVIYTSGTTGNPKGCTITHNNLSNYIQWANNYYFRKSNKANFGLYTSLSFDLTVTSIFCSLTQGSQLYIYSQHEELSTILIHSFNAASGIDSIKLTPSHINVLEYLNITSSSIIRAIVGGEEITAQQVSILKKINPFIEIYNEYGPTETTVGCVVKELEENMPILIGKPISQTGIYILNSYNSLVPIGVIGEIYISGASVGKGYLNQPALTAEKFIANPFKEGERMYKTGDLGRWLPDGNIEFIGRKDNQVKIRGYRIELNEIINKLLNHTAIQEAVVLAKEDKQKQKNLVAYYVPYKEISYTIHKIIETNQKELQTGAELHELPNKLSIYAYNKTELEFLYEEIFRDKCYLNHGITIPENGCIIDIGANIGVFSVFANLQNKGVKIYSFEPLPPTFELLKLNTSLYKGNFNVFNIGISDKEETVDFTYFPNATVLSSRYSEGEDITNIVKETIYNKEKKTKGEQISEEEVNELLENRLITKSYKCKLKTLSQVIEENKIEKIDLLKIDVEKSELDVLKGIIDKDWKKIKQIVLEVHDIDGRMEMITRILSEHRFQVYINQGSYLTNTNLYDVYAISEEIIANPYSQTENIEVAKQWYGTNDLKNNIENFLKVQLPSYMLPNYYVQLESLPLTQNGKIDKKRLPDPESLELSNSVKYLAPRNKTEEKLAAIWQEILGKEIIGVKDNFFELGGHSLRAVRLASQIHKEFEIKVELKELFNRAVLEEQAEFIQQSQKISFVNIPIVALQLNYPLSSAQRRLWVLSQFEEANIAYNMPEIYVFEGSLDISALEYSFNVLLERHEILRTVFKEDAQGEVRQYVQSVEEKIFKINYQDLRQAIRQTENVQAIVQREFIIPFNLAIGPLLRAALYQIADDKWIFTYTMHHIISDGWSMNIMIKELLTLYQSYSKGETNPLTPLRIQYKDYAVWQQERLQDVALQEHKNYWIEQFTGELPILELPADKLRPAVKTYNGRTIEKTINKNLTTNIKTLSHQEGCTLFMSLLALVNTLLYRYTGQEDIVIGSPIAGRDHADLEDQIGFYVNTLALRTQFKGTDNFKDLLKNIKQTTLEAYEHQMYPFDELLNNLNLQRDMSRSALFDVMLVLQNNETQTLEDLGGIKVQKYEGEENVISKFDLTFNFIETRDTLQLSIGYNTDIYTKNSIERLSNHFEQLLRTIVEQPSISINQLDYLTKEEKHQLLVAFNDTTATYSKDKTIIELFEEQVEKTPNNIAVVFEDKQLTYKQLNENTNQLAHYLRSNYSIAPNDLIGVQLERSEWMIIAILGILKSGAAYVPIDTDYPQQRINYMLSDSNCKTLITEEKLKEFITQKDKYAINNPSIINNPSDLAYIIYTSGTTGKPKGVVVQHRPVINLIEWVNKTFSINEQDRLLFVTSLSFDLSVYDVFGILATGASIVVAKKTDIQNPQKLTDLIYDYGITFWDSAPAALKQLMPLLVEQYSAGRKGNIRLVFMSGDWVPLTISEELKKCFEKVDVIALGGATEATIWSNWFKIDKINPHWTSIPYGKPIQNAKYYILDIHLNPCAIGIPGYIYIGGKVLALKYNKDKELTKEKFISNPFNQREKIYKTGDLGRWLPDGNIEFMGRKDEQVKVRGYRIELAEIEAVLQTHSSIETAIVIAKPNQTGEKELIAYIVSKEKLNTTEIRSYLSKNLPIYMLPSHYVGLEKMPLTPNGKLDKKALPNPKDLGLESGVEYIAPCNAIEEKLVEIWKEILERNKIGIKDNFFALGGHSLKATRMATQIYKTFGSKLALKELFQNPILEQQAQLIEHTQKTTFSTIPIAVEQDSYPLSSSQQRLWILSQFKEGNIACNIPRVYIFEGSINKSALEQSFSTLIERHEVLRTIFKEVENGEVRQYIKSLEGIDFKIDYQDLRQEEEHEQIVKDLVQQDFLKPFHLAIGPLLRVGLYQIENNKWIFTSVMHHIISDGWSMDIMIQELLTLYNAYSKGEANPLEPLGIQYKDYAVWQQEQLNKELLQEHKAYWLEQLKGEIPLLELATDKVRPAVKTYNGGNVGKRISAELSKGLKELCHQQGATLFMGVLAAVKTLLYRYTGQEDIIIGSPIAGREHADLENQIGFYVNSLALRTRFKGEDSYIDLLGRVKQITLEAYEHQLYPFDDLVNTLNLQRDTSRSPLYDVEVIVQNTAIDNIDQQRDLKDLRISAHQDMESSTSKFDMVFSFAEVDQELHLNVEYNSDIYNRGTIEQLANHVEQLLEAIIAYPSRAINALDYLSETERDKLLIEFNNTDVEYPEDKTIIGLFEEYEQKTPDAIATFYEGQTLTYKALNEKANQLANYLRSEYDIQSEDLVGIMLDRSEKAIIAILGILKAGAAYVPIDPEYPKERKEYILKDSEIKVLITQSEYIFDLDHYEGNVFATDLQLDTLNTAVQPLEITIDPNDLAYVIYTSGSTGDSKGVMIEHKAIANTIQSEITILDIKPQERILQFASLSFDPSVHQIFLSLVAGGVLYIINEIDKKNPLLLEKYITENKIDFVDLSPSYLQLLQIENIQTLKKLMTGGETAIIKDAHTFIQYGIFYNAYGPTECSVCTSIFKADNENIIKTSTVPIGAPIHNTEIYIVDKYQHLLPIGIVGEICISGSGLARGYLNQPELTKEKFVTNPFNKGDRMYKTGDLGRWLPDGNIEFMGRKDEQVKIRGYRIELGEIESVLHQHPEIEASVVVAKTNGAGEKELVAYIVSSETLNTAGIRSHLSKNLPSYMLPSYYVQLEQLPLTPNGKVDKKRLPALEGLGMNSGVEYVAPSNAIEEKLVQLWEEILGKEKIGVRDNFFELGGNSLEAVRLHSILNKKYNINVKIQDIYNNSTIEKLALVKSQNSRIIVLNEKSSAMKNNIYFIPPVFGNSIIYKPLSQKLGNVFNCYGFQYRGIEKDESLYTSIEEAASEFSEQIIKQQNDQPFIIFGYSMGAVIAFEMAKILEEKSKSFKLMLVDRGAQSNFKYLLKYVLQRDSTKWLLTKYRDLVPNEYFDQETIEKFLLNNNKILDKYNQKGKIKSSIYAFESINNKFKSKMKDWKNYTEGELKINFIQGDHWEALSEKNFSQFKQIIQFIFSASLEYSKV